MEDSTNSRPGKGETFPWGTSQWRRWLTVTVAALTLFGGFAYIGFVTQKVKLADEEASHLAAAGEAAASNVDALGNASGSEPAIARGDITGAPQMSVDAVAASAADSSQSDHELMSSQTGEGADLAAEAFADPELAGAGSGVGAAEALDNDPADQVDEQVGQDEQRVHVPAGVKHMPWLSPTRGNVIRPFGWTESPTYGDWRWHHGVDLDAESGSAVVAALPGIVEEIRNDARLGSIVVLTHTDNVSTVYAPCADISVKVGEELPGGGVVCKVGKSGLDETGMPSHLHFEIRHANKPVDPVTLIP